MSSPGFPRQLWAVWRSWWVEHSRRRGVLGASVLLARELGGFLRDSTPERRRRRYGDMDYDWEHRVNTTSGTVRWRERLLGVFLSPYQPTDAVLFREMIASLPIDSRDFTFVDLGSGKGRTLLMASEYSFRRIIGVEILPELHRAAEENIRAYRTSTQGGLQIESICGDARAFELPAGPLLLYLFNPLPADALDVVLGRLEQSLQRNPRPVYVLYHNPLLGERLRRRPWLQAEQQTDQFAVFVHRPAEPRTST